MSDSNEFFRGGNDGDALEVDLDPALDDLYRLLADHRRRAVLYVLAEANTRVHSVADLATRISRLEGGAESDSRDVWVELRHKHLPKMAECGLVEYDERSEVVVYRGDDRVGPLLAPAKEREVRG